MTRSFDDEPWGEADHETVIPPDLTVDIIEPNVVGTILGPDGEPLHDVLDRAWFPFGFCRSG